MQCIYCLHRKTEVNNSRKTRGSVLVWRRRHCKKCGAVFTTTESPLGDNLFVIKRSGRRQRFMYEKLLVSVVYAAERGKLNDRGDQAKFAKQLTEKIVAAILKEKRKEVETANIIQFCYVALNRINPHFAEKYMHYSEYREKICSPLRARLA